MISEQGTANSENSVRAAPHRKITEYIQGDEISREPQDLRAVSACNGSFGVGIFGWKLRHLIFDWTTGGKSADRRRNFGASCRSALGPLAGARPRGEDGHLYLARRCQEQA